MTLGVVLGALLSGGLDRVEQTPTRLLTPDDRCDALPGGTLRVLGRAMVTAILAVFLRAQAAWASLPATAWAAQAFEYLGPSDRAGLVATRGPVVGRLLHTFHGRRRP